ncbi:hypothetical protein AABB24_034088 [Solanum stoloniferum]|uniref:2Fe-2S ferredoxin-type domain-containing protein n=1 Tax=Solanum stoloniferum TaxID=62892 RepID=A0ABD2RG89_9SOLN
MAARITFRPPEFTKKHHKPLISLTKRIPTCISCTTTTKPEIELEFIGPKPDENGNYPMDKTKAVSGEKLLRNIMSENKIELYAAYHIPLATRGCITYFIGRVLSLNRSKKGLGKVMNCGGSGSCGTCIVEIIQGNDVLNERTNTELRYLKKKPESWRLACQTIVGNKKNSGKVVVQRFPQWKK